MGRVIKQSRLFGQNKSDLQVQRKNKIKKKVALNKKFEPQKKKTATTNQKHAMMKKFQKMFEQKKLKELKDKNLSKGQKKRILKKLQQIQKKQFQKYIENPQDSEFLNMNDLENLLDKNTNQKSQQKKLTDNKWVKIQNKAQNNINQIAKNQEFKQNPLEAMKNYLRRKNLFKAQLNQRMQLKKKFHKNLIKFLKLNQLIIKIQKMLNKIFSNTNEIVYAQKTNGQRQSLGSGSFGQVRLVSHKNNPKKKYAMKMIKNTNLTEMKLIFQEIHLHQNLNHPNIIKFEDYLEQDKKVYIFLEYAENGDLFGYINKHKLQEKELLRLFYQTCLAIQYLHSRNIMHRDLKPENILVDINRNIKVCDFGWSAIYRENEIRETVCGTLEYMAPEIFMKKRQTKKTDVWALGILLFELFHNRAPFRGQRADVILRQIKANKKMYKNSLNPKIKLLIEKILNKVPLMRPSVDEILQSDLFYEFKYGSKVISENKSVNTSQQNQNYQTKWVDSGFNTQQNKQQNIQIRFKSRQKNSHTTQDTHNNKSNVSQGLKTRPVSRRKIVINNLKRDYSAQVQSQRIIQFANQKDYYTNNYQVNKQFSSNGFKNYTPKKQEINKKIQTKKQVVQLEKSFANYLKKFQIIL